MRRGAIPKDVYRSSLLHFVVEVNGLQAAIGISYVKCAVCGIESDSSRYLGQQIGPQCLSVVVVPNYGRLVL